MTTDADFEIIDTPARRRFKPEVVIISEDEDVENRPATVPRRRTRPLSIDSSSSSSSVEVRTTHRSRHHVSKRQKAKHSSIIPERTRLGPLTSDNTDYTKANLLFMPNPSHGDLLFKTGETPPVPPQEHIQPDRNAFMQGSVREPCVTAPIPAVEEQCPWFYHPKLEVKMYRGPGYDRFPVVLGTVKGHKETCDQWDARKAEQHEEDQLYIASLTGGVSPFSTTKKQTTQRTEARCVQEVRVVFPQIQHKFVLEKYQARCAISDGAIPSAADIISEIAELHTYPKEEMLEEPDEVVWPEDGTGVIITYKKDTTKDDAYFQESLRILAGEFTHIPTITINRILREKQSLFGAFIYFNQAEATYFDMPRHQRPYIRSKQPRVFLEKKYQRNFCEPKDSTLYVNLINEFQAAKQHDARELYRLKKDRDEEAAEAQNLHRNKLEGSLVECQTCFDDEIPMNRAIMCEGDVGHFFCFGCVARLAESQIGAMKHEMMCMDGSGCKAILPIDGVGQAVPTKVVDKLAFYAQQAEISAAGIEGLEQCSHCEYKAICDPIEQDSVFACQNLDCGKITCRKCKEADHLPKTCDEAKKDKGLSARHLVEEARSEAMIRKCPKCKAKIIKELGCNKMVCSCGNMMCYVCQQDISGPSKDAGYQHFHKAGSKCPLYDAQGTERHNEDADAAEKAAIRKVKAQEGNQDLEDKELQIETGKEKQTAKKANNHQGARPHVRLANPPPFAPDLLDIVPPMPNDLRRHRVARDRQDLLRAQHHAVLQQQIDELRAQGERLQRARDVLDARRLDDMNRAARDAQDAARQAQENINRMMGAGQLYQMGGLNAFQSNQPFHLPGGPRYELFQNVYQPIPQPQQIQPLWNQPMPDLQFENDFGVLLFGDGRGENVIANANGNQQRHGIPNAAQEELDNQNFAGYVLGADRR